MIPKLIGGVLGGAGGSGGAGGAGGSGGAGGGQGGGADAMGGIMKTVLPAIMSAIQGAGGGAS